MFYQRHANLQLQIKEIDEAAFANSFVHVHLPSHHLDFMAYITRCISLR